MNKNNIKRKVSNIKKNILYVNKFNKFSFVTDNIKYKDYEQYEAVITRLYHTIEKSLSFQDFKAGHGIKNVNHLMSIMKNYVNEGYDINKTFYKCALSSLNEYVKKNVEYNYNNEKLFDKIRKMPEINNCSGGGVFEFYPSSEKELKKMNYEEFIKNRHSIRHFLKSDIDEEVLKKALDLAQFTPSACNRQGWKTIVISNKNVIKRVLENQNGNEGFGNEFNKLLLVLGDLRYYNNDRELYQVYIDSGMYAQSILNSLHYYHIGSVPLSASLTSEQEKNVRKILQLNDAEILIMFIGIGNYPNKCITTLSTRRKANIKIV